MTSSGGPADGGALAIRLAEAVVDSAVVNSNTATGASAHGGAIYAEGGVALYRAAAPIAGGTTFTLPIAVTTSG